MRFFRRLSADPLAASMAGVKLGDRVLVLGEDPPLLVNVAIKAGLTGRACVVVEGEERARSAREAAEREGALVEAFAAPTDRLPLDDDSFDVAIVRGLLPALSPDRRVATLREVWRVLRPGGRCLVIDPAARAGLGGLFSRRGQDEFYVQRGGAPTALQAEGFRAVRTIAERDGLAYVEGVKAVTGHT
jgi:SAM-dependent methyltransferase